MCSDGVQGALPQSMAPWHVDYFKAKKSEKWNVQEGRSDLPLEQVIKPPRREVPSQYPEERSILTSEEKGQRGRLTKQALLSLLQFPPVYYT